MGKITIAKTRQLEGYKFIIPGSQWAADEFYFDIADAEYGVFRKKPLNVQWERLDEYLERVGG